jgi:hypothetical protein
MGVKISNLPIIVTPALSDVFPVVQAGVTYKESFTQLTSLFATSGANSNITSLSGLSTPLSVGQGGTGSATGVTAGAVAASSGAGIPIQVVQGQFTTTTSIASSIPIASGITATITPTATTSKILIRAVINFSPAVADNGFLELFNGSTAIGLGAVVGSRTSVGSQTNIAAASQMINSVLEWLDSPATTSPITYSVRAWTSGGAQSYINRSITDTDNAAFARAASTITLMEIK